MGGLLLFKAHCSCSITAANAWGNQHVLQVGSIQRTPVVLRAQYSSVMGLPAGKTSPAHPALRQTLSAFYTPFDIGIRCKVCLARPAPHILQTDGHQSVLKAERGANDAVGVRKLGAGVRARGAENVDGLTEEKAQHIQVMDAHIQQGQPSILFQEALPMWNRPHFYRSQDGETQLAVVENLFEHPHRLIEAHILVDRHPLSRGPALPGQLACRHKIERQRLLRQDALDMWLLERQAYQAGLYIRGER